MLKRKYSKKFYYDCIKKNAYSAKVIVPMIFNIVKPCSVVEIGCSLGYWLREFMNLGVSDIMGIDGKWVRKQELLIPEECFTEITIDSKNDLGIIKKKYDLVICLECAEHIKEEAEIVKQLCTLGDVVLFSAAIPNQGGKNHVNEQYQSYWIRQFEEEGFLPIDCIRKKIWSYSKIRSFYKQNMFLFVKESLIESNLLYRELYQENKDNIWDLVHPEYYAMPVHSDQSWQYIFCVLYRCMRAIAGKIKIGVLK